MSDLDFGMEQEELAFNELDAEDLDEELDDDGDFVDLAPLYVQDSENVDEIPF